jgi:broad-specificity NMP kinase
MKIIITGPVASGKTTLSQEIKKKFNFQNFLIINDKEFSQKHNLGQDYKDGKEYEVDMSKFSKKASDLLNSKKNIIFEGHLFCDVSKLFLKKIDFIFLLKNSEKVLKERMKERNYDVLKIEENILCQKINYFQDKLFSKKIDFIEINLSNDLKLDVKKINKFLKL